LPDSLNAIAVQATVAKIADVKRLWDETFQKFGRLDILVNSVGAMFNKLNPEMI
jgi:3-oxoacyl-[acyl-carrier protein] reductase